LIRTASGNSFEGTVPNQLLARAERDYTALLELQFDCLVPQGGGGGAAIVAHNAATATEHIASKYTTSKKSCFTNQMKDERVYPTTFP
jgi:hypothetical protein